MYRHFFKRVIDFIVVFCALSILWPILLLITLWLHFANKGAGAFFLQERPGKNGKIFKVIKFKTMTDERDDMGKLLPDAKRLTKVGRFVRSTSLDELPQLFNVLLGDMSLVGPRPPLPAEVRTYTLEERKRLNITPGITCLWQISGRSELPFQQQMALDKEYIASRSTWNDFLILLKTIPAIITGRGAW